MIPGTLQAANTVGNDAHLIPVSCFDHGGFLLLSASRSASEDHVPERANQTVITIIVTSFHLSSQYGFLPSPRL